jgi:predicted site-specific integrase-resolvase
MANALVVHKTQLPRSQSASRAAQYVRMSTEHQRYSIENQAAVIATYARLHGLTIVETYRDAGLSGLRLKNRTGLIRKPLAMLPKPLQTLRDFSTWLRFTT